MKLDITKQLKMFPKAEQTPTKAAPPLADEEEEKATPEQLDELASLEWEQGLNEFCE